MEQWTVMKTLWDVGWSVAPRRLELAPAYLGFVPATKKQRQKAKQSGKGGAFELFAAQTNM